VLFFLRSISLFSSLSCIQLYSHYFIYTSLQSWASTDFFEYEYEYEYQTFEYEYEYEYRTLEYEYEYEYRAFEYE
jgi:hypothetical protein